MREEGNTTQGTIPGGLASRETSLTYRANRYGKMTVGQEGAICLPITHAILTVNSKTQAFKPSDTRHSWGLHQLPIFPLSSPFPYLYQSHVPCYHLPELFGCIHLANISLQEDIATSSKTDSILYLLTVKFLPYSYVSLCQEQERTMTSSPLLLQENNSVEKACVSMCACLCVQLGHSSAVTPQSVTCSSVNVAWAVCPG